MLRHMTNLFVTDLFGRRGCAVHQGELLGPLGTAEFVVDVMIMRVDRERRRPKYAPRGLRKKAEDADAEDDESRRPTRQ